MRYYPNEVFGSQNGQYGYHIDGGPGSGNFNHGGREGKVGGSTGGGKKSSKQVQYEKKLDSEKEALLGQKPNKQAMELYHASFLSKDKAVQLMKQGDLSQEVEEYYGLLKANGDSTSSKPLNKQQNAKLADEVGTKYPDYREAREAYIKDWTGMNDSEAKKTQDELDTWFSGSWDRADTKTIDNYIDKDHTYDGEIYRGLRLLDSEYNSFMDGLKAGDVIRNKGGKNASWSSSEEVARRFAGSTTNIFNSVTIKCLKNRTSAPVDHLSTQGEDEVLSHSKAQWTVLSYSICDKGNGKKDVRINVIEKGKYSDE